MYSKQNNMQLLMSNIQNKIAHFVNFIKHKKRICGYTHYTHMGLLKTKQKTNLYIILLPEILMQKIFKQNGM